MSEILSPENQEQIERRTISTARLERLREASSQSVKEFIESLLEYEVENPSESFQESITKFGEKISSVTKPKKVTAEKEPDWDKLTVEYLVDHNIYPITGVLNRMQASRKYEGEHVYSVNIEQGPGTKAQTICDLTDLSAVRVEINGVLLKIIDVLGHLEIPNRVYKQGYHPEVQDQKAEEVESVNKVERVVEHSVTVIYGGEPIQDTVQGEVQEEEIF